MRSVSADRVSTDGFVGQATVVSGTGSGLRAVSRVSRIVCSLKRRHERPRMPLGGTAAIRAAKGHEVMFTDRPGPARHAGRAGDDVGTVTC